MGKDVEDVIAKIKIIYPPLIEEINRYRDWPIRILTFTSVFYFGLIGSILSEKIKTSQCGLKFGLLFAILTLYGWTVYFCRKCHINYLRARNTQVRIQKRLNLQEWEVEGTPVFPKYWFNERPETWREGFWGWGFYLLYATILCAISFVVIVWGPR